jgi:hypothetical protein
MAIGPYAGANNTVYSNWTAIGTAAAASATAASGGGNAVHFENSVYIGRGVLATNGTSVTPTTNETVIGHQASGLGSNSTVIGNSSTTRTHFFGNTTIGGTTAAAFTPTARLDVRSAGNTSDTDIVNFENSDGDDILRIESNGKNTYWATNTATGTTGARTINRPSGTVNFAAGATSLVVTNSLCTTSSIVFAVVRTNDTTADIKNVEPGAGQFTIRLNAAATAETSVGFFIIN